MSANPSPVIGERHFHLCGDHRTHRRHTPICITPRPTPSQRLQKWLTESKINHDNTKWPLSMKMPKKVANANGYETTNVFIDQDGSVHLDVPDGTIIGKLGCLA